jgi:site-specific DNA-methyltransferase (adenine-specific)
MQIEELQNRIVNADCLDILRQLPDKSIDLVLTDPPYGLQAKSSQGSGKLKSRAFNQGDIAAKWDKVPEPEYFAEIFRVSKNQIIWGGNYFTLPPCRAS